MSYEALKAELNGLTYAFEYERGPTHSISQIIDKNNRTKLLYDVGFFVYLQSNERTVKRQWEYLIAGQEGLNSKTLLTQLQREST